MKRNFVFITLLIILSLFTCKSPDPPTVAVTPKEWTGNPSKVNFTATSTFWDAKAVCAGYNFFLKSSNEPGVKKSFVSKDGKLTLDLFKAGDYEMTVTVTDEFGKNVGSNGADKKPFVVKITVLNPFEKMGWTLNKKVIYTGKPLEMDAGIAKATKNEWEIYKPGDFVAIGSKDNKSSLWSGESKDGILYSDPIIEVGKDYTLVHTATDTYGNKFSWIEKFEVISEEEPSASGFVYRNVDKINEESGETVSEVEVCSLTQGNEALDQQPLVYVGIPLNIDVSQSQAGVKIENPEAELTEQKADPLKFKEVWVDLYHEGNFENRLIRTAAEENFQVFSAEENRWVLSDLIWTPKEEGRYNLKLTVFNELGKKKEATDNGKEDFHTIITPNIPTAEFVGIERFGESKNYEGHKAAFKIKAESPSPIGGRITEFTVHFAYKGKELAPIYVDLAQIPELISEPVFDSQEFLTSDYEAGKDWVFFHDPNGLDTFDNYDIWVTCKNEKYESAEGQKHTMKIYNNDPTVVCKVNDMEGAVSLFWGDTTAVTVSMAGTGTPDNEYHATVKLFKMGSNGEPEGNALATCDSDSGAVSFVYSKETAGKDFAFGSGNTGDAQFIARTTLTSPFINPNTFTKDVVINLSDEKTVSQMKVQSKTVGATLFFADETVTVDFGDSKYKDGENCRVAGYEDLTLTVKYNDKPYDKFIGTTSQTDKGLITKNAKNDKQFNVKLGLPGLYQFTLQVGTGGNKDISVKEINVVNNTPSTLEVTQADGIYTSSDTDKNGIGTDGEGRYKLYKFTVTGAFPSGETVYKWYDTVPVPGIPNLTSVIPVQSNEVVVKLRGDETSLYVVAQNVGGSSVAKAFPVKPEDLIPGVAPVVEAVAAKTSSNTPSIKITAGNAADTTTYRVQVKGGTDWFVIPQDKIQGVEKIVTYTLQDQKVADGQEKTIEVFVQACDTSTHENWSESTRCAIVIDKKPPMPPVVSTEYVENTTNQGQPVISWSKDPKETEKIVKYRYRQLNAGTEWVETTELTAKMKKDGGDFTTGDYSFEVQAQDEAGNWSESATQQVIIDVTPPKVPVKGVFKEITNEKRPTWVWACGDDKNAGKDDITKGYRCQLGSEEGDWINKDVSDPTFKPSVDLGEGPQTLYVQARDAAGNWSESLKLMVNIDLTPPAAVTTLPIKSPTNAEFLNWKWNSVPDANGGYKIKVTDGNNAVKVEETLIADTKYDFKAPDSAVYIIYIKAVDAAGNESAPAQISCTVDRIAPGIPTVVATAPVRFGSISQWNLTCVDDSTIKFYYKMNDNTGYPEGWTLADNANPEVDSIEGQNTLYVKAVDEAGNVSEVGSGSTICGTFSTDYTVTWDYAVDIAQIQLPTEVKVGGQVVQVANNFNSMTKTKVVDSRLVGLQKMSVEIVDKAGTPVSFEIPVNVKAPTVNLPNGDFNQISGRNTDNGRKNATVGWEFMVGVKINDKNGLITNSTPSDMPTVQIPTSSVGTKEYEPAYAEDKSTSTVKDNIGNFNAGDYGIRFDENWHISTSLAGQWWVVHTGGTCTTSVAIKVFKGVNYKVTGQSFLQNKSGGNACTNPYDVRMNLLCQGGLTVNSGKTEINNINPNRDAWYNHDFNFTPDIDGEIKLQFEKTHPTLSKDNWDTGFAYFDNATIQIVNYPKVQ